MERPEEVSKEEQVATGFWISLDRGKWKWGHEFKRNPSHGREMKEGSGIVLFGERGVGSEEEEMM